MSKKTYPPAEQAARFAAGELPVQQVGVSQFRPDYHPGTRIDQAPAETTGWGQQGKSPMASRQAQAVGSGDSGFLDRIPAPLFAFGAFLLGKRLWG